MSMFIDSDELKNKTPEEVIDFFISHQKKISIKLEKERDYSMVSIRSNILFKVLSKERRKILFLKTINARVSKIKKNFIK